MGLNRDARALVVELYDDFCLIWGDGLARSQATNRRRGEEGVRQVRPL